MAQRPESGHTQSPSEIHWVLGIFCGGFFSPPHKTLKKGDILFDGVEQFKTDNTWCFFRNMFTYSPLKC